ncbi:MAG: DUF4271 domain-containing protein [Lentimicrobiaceae bacterium]|nr:DUF4271 domain-containing protein [Lentimicrobiaceae bacterium]
MYKRKTLLMLRALFSARYLQQLLREGKLTNEGLYFYSILLCFIAFPCLILTLFQFYPITLLETCSYWQVYAITFGIPVVGLIISNSILQYFTEIFNYQEERYLYISIKTLFRFHNALLLLFVVPIIWYARIPELIFIVYIPMFIIMFLAFFVHFLRNISGVSCIHFFIYFCSLEILPYLLIVKLLTNNM